MKLKKIDLNPSDIFKNNFKEINEIFRLIQQGKITIHKITGRIASIVTPDLKQAGITDPKNLQLAILNMIGFFAQECQHTLIKLYEKNQSVKTDGEI